MAGWLPGKVLVALLGRIRHSALAVQTEMALRKSITPKIGAPNGRAVLADRQMLYTMLRNLVSNAIKFTPDGGAITVSAREENGTARIRVEDTGVGMTPAQLGALFSLGEQAKSTPGTEGKTGSGLGLLLGQELAGKNSGSITAEGEPGQGSAFTHSLPLPDAERC